MKAIDLLKTVSVAVFTIGIAVGCANSGSGMTPAVESPPTEEKLTGPTPELKSAIYAAKLKNARARNLGYEEWRDNAEIIEEAEQAAAEGDYVRAKILAEKAEQLDADIIDEHNKAMLKQEEEAAAIEASVDTIEEKKSSYQGGYLVIDGDNLWDIAGQDSVYGNSYQWPLIYKTNADQIEDADLIFPGQYFNISTFTNAESDAAINHAKTRGAWTIGETEAADIQYLNR